MPVEVFRTLIDEETLNGLSRRESSLDYESAAIMRVLLDMDDETDRVEASKKVEGMKLGKAQYARKGGLPLHITIHGLHPGKNTSANPSRQSQREMDHQSNTVL
jgi:hypothetical protein